MAAIHISLIMNLDQVTAEISDALKDVTLMLAVGDSTIERMDSGVTLRSVARAAGHRTGFCISAAAGCISSSGRLKREKVIIISQRSQGISPMEVSQGIEVCKSRNKILTC
jgi:hypothetical protein